jgi:glycosyltransferase involved in cell wall biosynthesis
MIFDVVTNTLKSFPNIVVIDDGSKDETARHAKDAGAFVIRHPINLGQGAALQTGIDFAIINDAKVIVTFDADGQHRVEDAIAIVKHLKYHQLDVVCGSRFLGLESKTIPKKRKFWLKLAAIFTKLTTGVPVSDAHNGLRAMSSDAAKKIRITQNRMAHASEFISQVKKNSLSFDEIPVEIIYSPYSLEKGQKLTNSFNILIDLLIGKIDK